MNIECSFPLVEWIHHHHYEDKVDLEEVKLMKRLPQHLTTLHHLNQDNLVFKCRLCHNQGFPSYDPWGIPDVYKQPELYASSIGHNPTPPPKTYAQPSTQQGVKLFKLVKDARLLGCETFSRSVDAIVAKNWLKNITNTMIDMELEDRLKLKVATKLMDKSAATWWDNLKLRTSIPIT